MPHQVAVCQAMVSGLRGMLVQHTMGSGKTLTALSAALAMVARRIVKFVVVLVPTTLKAYWLSQAVRVGFPEGTLAVESHRRWLDHFAAGRQLLHAESLLVVDEVHNMRGDITDAKAAAGRCMAANFVSACSAASKVMLLSGTAVVNGLQDLRNITAALDGRGWRSGNASYPARGGDGRAPLHALQGRMSYYEPDAATAAGLLRMPEMREVHHAFVMDDQYAAWYAKVEEEQLVSAPGKDPTVFLNGVRRAVNASNDEVHSPKLAWLQAEAATWAARGEKMAIYSAWVEYGARRVTSVLETAGVSYAVVDGTQTSDSRHKIIQRFNKGGIQALVFTAAGSEGMDLVGTRHLVVLEPHWHMARVDQAVARARRVGSHDHLPVEDRNVTVHHLVLQRRERSAGDVETMDIKELSADEYLFMLSRKKQSVCRHVIVPFMKTASIGAF